MHTKALWALMSLAVVAAAGCSAETKDKLDAAKAARREAISSAVEDAAKAAQGLAKDSAQLHDKLTGLLEGLTETLRGIKDSETAQAALTRLKECEQTLGELAQSAEKLPAAARPMIAAVAQRSSTKIKELIEQVQQNENLPESVKPVLDAILQKLAAFEAAPE
ncbi:MAG: hypothetical protein MUF48_17700 [Pirellulaceae bacterium]|jgi:archaellum component FlaC|nr:hypothetical protein [Pirellulaceae bacterium]